MKLVLFKWKLHAKQLDHDETSFLYKDRCVLHGDKQQTYINYDPEQLCAPAEAYETMKMILLITAGQGLDIEGADVENAYLHRKLDITINMGEPTDSSCIIARPGMVCL